jgi:hypothetical protein
MSIARKEAEMSSNSDRLPGETGEEYARRLAREAPPLSEEAKILIREIADEYWAERDREQAEARRKQHEAGQTY